MTPNAENTVLTVYTCTDEGDWPAEISAATPQDAADKYVAESDWPIEDHTWWCSVDVDGEHHKVAVNPAEPACSSPEHEWARPHTIVGGLIENPGVYSNNGGVTVTSACLHCGCKMVEDSGAYDPCDGQRGLDSIKYTPGFFTDRLAAAS